MANKRNPLRKVRHWLCLMLLFVIIVHASEPVSQPLDRMSGSAFSAATADVSLACGQPSAIIKRVVPSSPAVCAQPVSGTSDVDFVAIADGGNIGARWATGPPVRRDSYSPVAPRAPPAA